MAKQRSVMQLMRDFAAMSGEDTTACYGCMLNCTEGDILTRRRQKSKAKRVKINKARKEKK